ncbi:hypothetical protein NKG05_24225 [Oerskovia sp. M15]
MSTLNPTVVGTASTTPRSAGAARAGLPRASARRSRTSSTA